MTRVASQDIAAQLPTILSRVAQGEEFVVTDHGQAVARIVPLASGRTVAAKGENWRRQFDNWMKDVDARANRYPAGFTLDDGRETIYDGRGV